MLQIYVVCAYIQVLYTVGEYVVCLEFNVIIIFWSIVQVMSIIIKFMNGITLKKSFRNMYFWEITNYTLCKDEGNPRKRQLLY